VIAQLARLCFVVLCSGDACTGAPPSSDSMVVVRTADSTVVTACDELAQGRAWRATRTLEPVLADPVRRTPDVVLLAAAAAAEWQGWQEVTELLDSQPWLDTLQAGRGRVLLARAALETGADSVARLHAEASIARAHDPAERARRTVILARALDRLTYFDSARSAYLTAARGLPLIADWLSLRAAALTPSSKTRATMYEALTLPAAKTRAPRVEAQTLERVTHDLRAYAAVGEEVQALRLRADAATTSNQRAIVRSALLSIIKRSPGSGDAQQAIAVLDDRYGTPSPGADLVIARSLAVTGPFPRAATSFRRAIDRGLATSRDRLTYATVLRRLNRHRGAIEQLARIRDLKLVPDAELLRARSLLAIRRGANARAVLRSIPKRFPRDTAAASGALFLLADLATDERRDMAARTTLRDLARRYPTSDIAATARFRAALIAYIHGKPRQAAMEFDTLAESYSRSSEALSAVYWAGRAWNRVGDKERAITRWNQLLARDPLSYYSAAAARRLGEQPWAPTAMADAFPRVPVVDSIFARADALTRLGMDGEARFEYDQALRDASDTPPRLLATAGAFRTRAMTHRAIQLGWRLVAKGDRDARAYRLVYPVSMGDALVAEARARRVDPALVAAIIRQESSFNPRATSGPGARGLMQVMPNVGGAIARSLGYPYWSPDLLFEPDVNLQIGVNHLRSMLAGRPVVRALAAYNAGDGRVARWSKKAGTDDPEVFVERIPFVETRDYVRIVLRNRDLYRALYGWNER